jgi:metal-sulfur cluster biosynthetic enzyme
VTAGPLCVHVRRWGFPHSPVHPLFTPSRMHIDQTYVFYAGLPYFLKEGRFDTIKDLQIEAMRDDEWVFSGYSFTDTLWIDSTGKLHEGSVPAEHADKLWGVGFFHRDSRDAFIALWLEHAAENFDALRHSGAPTLHYPGHGQLWSRYPAHGARLQGGTSIRQKNAYLVAAYPQRNPAEEIQRLRHQLCNALELRTDKLASIKNAKATGALARLGETAETAPLKPAIWKTLRQVTDEQLYKIDANIVDMGYVYDVRVRNGVVYVLVTMPHRGRPMYNFLVTQGGGRVKEGIRERLLKLAGIRDVVVEFTWNPPWTAARLADSARRALLLPEL